MKNDFKNFSDFEKEKNILNIPLVSESNETGYKVEGEEKKIKLPNTLSETIIKELDDRLEDEYHAYFFYVNAHNWCKDKNYIKAAAFFQEEYEAELVHARTMMDYMIDWNYKSKVKKVETDYKFNSLVDIIEQAYDIEYELLKKYNISSNKIFVEGDIATFDFLKFFRDTQIGEVREYSDFLNALQLIDATDKYQILYFENHYF